ncbi:hypothetical protein BH09PLA1_BH09PLA1_29460 [soil metagenome]
MSRSWFIALTALFIFPLLFPGQTPFVNDEAMLMQKALRHNAEGSLADSGLTGTQGRKYGPLPVWIDQAILLITHDPIAIMSIRIALVTALLLCGLLSLQQTLQLWKWGLPAIAMSPYVWYFARQLWDNSFNLPLSVVCLAAYVSFLARPRAAALFLVLVLGGAMLLVHWMAAPLVGAALIHLAITRPRELKRFWQPAAFATLIVLFAGIRYWPQVTQFDGAFVARSNQPNSAWFALLGPRNLSGAWIEYIFPRDWLSASSAWRVLFEIARALSLIAFPLTWFGMILGAIAVARVAKLRGQSTSLRPRTITDDAAIVCTLAIAGQIVLNIITHTHGHPHYYNGTFAAYAMLMWIALDRLLKRWPRARFLGWTQLAGVSALCVLLLVRVIQTRGTRDLHFGSTLNSQIEVVRDLTKYSELSPVRFDVVIMPRSLQVLEALRPHPRDGTEPTRDLVIRYRASKDDTAGAIELAEDARD